MAYHGKRCIRLVGAIGAGLVAAAPAAAQFKGYFDVSGLALAGLAEPHWARRMDGEQLRYLCIDQSACAMPTGITIKGVLRAENLDEALVSGPLSPEKLAAEGKANAARTGSEFLEAKAIAPAGLKGVHMEAAANVGARIYFITRWIGSGERLLDIKVTSPDLAHARHLADETTAALVPQVFR